MCKKIFAMELKMCYLQNMNLTEVRLCKFHVVGWKPKWFAGNVRLIVCCCKEYESEN